MKVFIKVLNASMMTIAAVILVSNFVSYTSVETTFSLQTLPGGTIAPTPLVTHLAYVAYSEQNDNGSQDSQTGNRANTIAFPVDNLGRINTDVQPQQLFGHPNLATCEIDSLRASPNGRYLALEYNCEANMFIHILDIAHKSDEPQVIPWGSFLDWSPDGNWFLFHEVDQDEVWLIHLSESEEFLLNLPVGTYRATFSPDGQHVLYAASNGLGFGSEMGLLDLKSGQRTTLQQHPNYIIATPQWAPDGSWIAYILLPDNNVPYTTGELWLANANGSPLRLLDEVDAGHGYPPVWSPDGHTITYVRRENTNSSNATYYPDALHSNIYQIEVTTGNKTQLTYFNESLVYDPVWSPDGRQLVFTAQDAVWLLQPGGQPTLLSLANSIARHPAWMVEQTP